MKSVHKPPTSPSVLTGVSTNANRLQANSGSTIRVTLDAPQILGNCYGGHHEAHLQITVRAGYQRSYWAGQQRSGRGLRLRAATDDQEPYPGTSAKTVWQARCWCGPACGRASMETVAGAEIELGSLVISGIDTVVAEAIVGLGTHIPTRAHLPIPTRGEAREAIVP